MTGASGYLGRHLVRRLLEEDIDIVAVGRDARNQPWPSSPRIQSATCDLGQVASVRALAEVARRVDVVFHMAAVVSGSHAEAMRGTVVGSQNLLEAFAPTGARFVLAEQFQRVQAQCGP